eukprot:CAMPEP_0204072512 /NCGR_PEP_ID=MMETSP0360-20130528/161798_1 /ASSEMBLY_ACC=CAM_ASM_000342 /TAXON_ID=268821 /ORGANISM="Scrippsiella Hangoei, Strain SHTV-5" /LENGTH=58 /DNA_ID=CAMNT_0051020845 /DNA_START=160 /DNA_END=336 /DNA_ORIENTATION=-
MALSISPLNSAKISASSAKSTAVKLDWLMCKTEARASMRILQKSMLQMQAASMRAVSF